MSENVDMIKMVTPKSDQLNADDLIGGPKTIRITAVKESVPRSKEQPVSVFFDGDEGKPWKPCKTMSRVMIAMWGDKGAGYIGKRLTLYRDSKVKIHGIEVGGVRVSHAEIPSDMTVVVTVSRGVRAAITIKKLAAEETKRTLAEVSAVLTDAGMTPDERKAWLEERMPGRKTATFTAAEIDKLHQDAEFHAQAKRGTVAREPGEEG
jgi:hypothetical protein